MDNKCIVAIPKETSPNEKRISITPSGAKRLAELGIKVLVEKGMGSHLDFSEHDYSKYAMPVSNRAELLRDADIILRLRRPDISDIAMLKRGAVHISHLDPFREKVLVKRLAGQGVSTISMEMIPRTTAAQKMDSQSSQASLSGYVAVIIAASRLQKIFPMMITAAGTISPARVFVIGAGVAGLSAIATAKRLGAVVYAYDIRPDVEEQIKSLGARFVRLDLGNDTETKGGYAKELSAEKLKRQQEVMYKHCSQADVVITTAQVFGRPAPVIVTNDMIRGMKKGSVVIDLAVDNGGNVECSKRNQEVIFSGVTILGSDNLSGNVSINASQVYSNNLVNFVCEFFDKDSGRLELPLNNDIIKGCLITHKGEICKI